MKWIKFLVLIVAMLIAFAFAALSVNQEEVTLTFAIWETPFPLSMFWWMLAAFLVGVFFSMLIALWMNIKHRLGARKLKKSLTQVNAELERMRAHSVQG